MCAVVFGSITACNWAGDGTTDGDTQVIGDPTVVGEKLGAAPNLEAARSVQDPAQLITGHCDDDGRQVALEMLGAQGSQTVTQEACIRATRDIKWIRNFDTSPIEGVQGDLPKAGHLAAWQSDALIVALESGATLDDIAALNEQFGGHAVAHSRFYEIIFDQHYNMPALVQVYQQHDAVEYAEINTAIGDGSKWYATDVDGSHWRWEVEIAWGDCSAGCICTETYTFIVDDGGGVTFVSFSAEEPGCTGGPVVH